MKYAAVVIGASAGGIQALRSILASLSSDFSLPIIVVQHRPPTLDNFFVDSLNTAPHLLIKEADDKEPIKPKHVYFAPANYHLLVEQNKTLSLSVDAKVRYSRPSIDILFSTASDAYFSQLIGIILTGANDDGTEGLKHIKAHGGLTIAHDPQTAVSPEMPRSAIREKVIDKILSLTEIAHFLNTIH